VPADLRRVPFLTEHPHTRKEWGCAAKHVFGGFDQASKCRVPFASASRRRERLRGRDPLTQGWSPPRSLVHHIEGVIRSSPRQHRPRRLSHAKTPRYSGGSRSIDLPAPASSASPTFACTSAILRVLDALPIGRERPPHVVPRSAGVGVVAEPDAPPADTSWRVR
jgi:hypothetical protein